MAGADPVLTRVLAAVAAFDDAALEASVGAGALRLGRRDVASPPRVEGDAVRVAVGAFEVSMRKGPADARCTCPARRACRHVAAAVLALRTGVAAPPVGPAACGQAGSGVAAGVGGASAGPVGGDGVVEGPAGDVGAGGGSTSFPAGAPGAAPARPRRVRGASASTDALGLVAPLGGFLDDGLTRLSQGSAALVHALAASARAADRPRVEAALARLGGEIARQLARDARASTAAILDPLADAWEAAASTDAGRWRGEYAAAGTLHLTGLGARAWASQGGWHGLTVYFGDEDAGACLSWTEARREGLRPSARYRESGPWDGAPQLDVLCRRRVSLEGAWRDERGRLSSRPSTRCTVGDGSDPLRGALVVDDFREVVRRALRHLGGPLEETALVVVLRPAAWEAASFDAVAQVSTRFVSDARGARLPVSLPYDPTAPGALSAFEEGTPDGVLGRVAVVQGMLCVEPWTLYCGDRQVNLTLDVGGGAGVGAPASDAAASSTALGLLLGRVEAALERAAERGRARPFDDDLTAPLGAVGLSTCAEALAAAPRSTADFLAAWRIVRRAARLEAVAAAVERAGMEVD